MCLPTTIRMGCDFPRPIRMGALHPFVPSHDHLRDRRQRGLPVVDRVRERYVKGTGLKTRQREDVFLERDAHLLGRLQLEIDALVLLDGDHHALEGGREGGVEIDRSL